MSRKIKDIPTSPLLDKVVPIEVNTPHKVSEVICVKCGKRWISVRQADIFLKNIVCPNCGAGYVIETGEEMTRFNVQHPETKQWRCFSTVVDNYVTDWMDEERYQKWREYEYGRHAGPIREANLMSYEKAEEKIALRKKWDEEVTE